MIKLTLFDACCVSFATSTACFFVDTLEEFETPWLAQTTNADLIERFQKSKSGILTTDYYVTDSPDLDIVQKDDSATILYESEHILEDCEIEVLNVYDYPTRIFAKRAEIQLRYIQFKDQQHLIGRYRLEGVYRENTFLSTDDCKLYDRLLLCGNTVFTSHFQEQPLVENPILACKTRPFHKEAYANDSVETFCWVEIYPRGLLTKEEFEHCFTPTLLSDLMRDIVGEAG